jgi:hypothetical protein
MNLPPYLEYQVRSLFLTPDSVKHVLFAGGRFGAFVSSPVAALIEHALAGSLLAAFPVLVLPSGPG